jgi:beta-lactamase superfamily II metal-dependent hydrolase
MPGRSKGPMTSGEMVIFDVGHGNAALYVGQGDVLVIDGGADYTLADYVHARELTDIDAIYISHADEDHLVGALFLLESLPRIKVAAVYVNPAQAKNSDLWLSFSVELERLEAAGTRIITALTRSFPGDVQYHSATLQVLSPPPARVMVENRDNRWSAILRLVAFDEPVALFCADVDNVGLSEVLKAGKDMTAAVLIFPHHGGRPGNASPETFASTLVRAVRPSLVVFSMGRGRYDNPLPGMVKAVRAETGAHIACTQLSKRCSGRVFPDRDVHPHSAGRKLGLSCSGTIALKLPLREVQLQDDLKRHRDFVDILAEGQQSPQCREPSP